MFEIFQGGRGPVPLPTPSGSAHDSVYVYLQVVFIRKEELPREKMWFLYFVGGCVILECIFTDVLLYNK